MRGRASSGGMAVHRSGSVGRHRSLCRQFAILSLMVLGLYAALLVDRAHDPDASARRDAALLLDLLTPIVKAWGSPLRSPYMTLSFMALLVIPSLKISDRGLFDGDKFQFCRLFD